MGRSRSRSRSRKGDRDRGGGRGGEVVKAFEFNKDRQMDDEDNDALRAVKAAINTLPPDTADGLKNLFNGHGLTLMDLDVKAIVGLAQLHVALQKKVCQHLEQEKVFLCNSRSKARFLSSACERAKQGALDVRGFGAIDPWKNHLNALAQKVPKEINFVPEEDWIEKVGKDAMITIVVDCADDEGLKRKYADGIVEYKVPITETAYEVKKLLEADGAEIPINKMKLLETKVLGFLKDQHSFGHYNAEPQSPLEVILEEKIRGGMKGRKDFSVRRPYPQSRPHIAQLAGMKTPQMMLGKAPAPMMNMMAKMPGVSSGLNPMMMMAKMAPLMAKMMAAKGLTVPANAGK